MTTSKDTGSAWWPVALAATAVLGSLATACMMPFVAIATVAAATMPRGPALIAVLGAWAANQLLGFGLLGYPVEAHAVLWGVALGVASLIVVPLAARIATASLARLALAFCATFVVWEALLFCFALVAGGLETFTPGIVARLFANEAMWLAVLTALHLVASRGAPRLFGASRIHRLA